MASKPAVINAMGVPCKAGGTLVRAKRSRRPAKIMIASVNPMALAKVKQTACNKLKSFWTLKMAIPKTAQLVVIKGKNMPRAPYKAGESFFKMISTICTNDAMTNMKTMVVIKVKLFGTNTALYKM